MKRLLFIGNGFDLAHGLPTRYTDFLYVCQKYIGKDFEYKTDYPDLMNSVVSLYIQNYGDKYKDLITNNIWIKHFVVRFGEIGENWIDFEKEIRNICDQRFELIDNSSLFSIFSEKYPYFIDFVENKFKFKAIKNNLNDLIILLNSYLKIINMLEIPFYSEDVIGFAPTDIISFNYTSTYAKNYGIGYKTDYIHGRIGIVNTKNSIVLGFNSYNDNKKDFECAEFLKYYQMVNNNLELEVLGDCNPQLDDIYSMFFGHSLDETDSDIIKEAVEKSKLVFVMASSAGHKSSMIKNLINIYGERKFRELCLNKGKKIIFLDQKPMANKFHPFYEDLVLGIDKILKHNASREIYISFMNNFIGSSEIGIIGLSELYRASFSMISKGITQKEFDFWTDAILQAIEAKYADGDKLFIKPKDELINELKSIQIKR